MNSSSSSVNSNITILYKFRSGTNFESLPLADGGAVGGARLLDIKRAIVQARNLGSGAGVGGTLEFDLAVQDASTGQEYNDENAFLPRGARIVVRRVAAERGRGLLSRIANMGYFGGGGDGPSQQQTATAAATAAAARDDFYTIRADREDDEDEFIDSSGPTNTEADESRELEALRAVTDQAGTMYSTNSISSSSSTAIRPRDPRLAGAAGGGGMVPPPHFAKPPPHPTAGAAATSTRPTFHTNTSNHPHQFSRNADPELRQQEAMMMAATQPKKRATGIPRTFLTLSATTTAGGEGGGVPTSQASAGGGDATGSGVDAGGGGGDLATQLQPPVQAFQALVRSGGGQSTSSSNNSGRRDLDYALRLTATTLPDHLTCGICHKLAKMAMLVPWDAEGRPTCESCIRDGLVKGGYTCPLTGMEGVSPDDLFPNVGLRKAVEAFEADIMAKMEMIEKQIEADELKEEEERRKRKKSEEEAEAGRTIRRDTNEFDEDGGDGILLRNRRGKGAVAKKRKDDLFGGDDEFGGDVFDVAGDVDEADDGDEIHSDHDLQLHSEGKVINDKHGGTVGDNEPIESCVAGDDYVNRNDNDPQSKNNETNAHSQKSDQPHENDDNNVDENGAPAVNNNNSLSPSTSAVTSTLGSVVKPTAASAASRREPPRRARGPPAGYVLGPAGGGVVAGVGGIAHPPPPLHNNIAGAAVVPPPPPPPPPRGVGVPPPYHQQGDNAARGGRGGRFYPNPFGGRGGGRGGGRFPSNHFNYQQQQLQPPQPFSPNIGVGRGVGGIQHSMPPHVYPNPHGGGIGGGRGYGFPHGNQQWVSC